VDPFYTATWPLFTLRLTIEGKQELAAFLELITKEAEEVLVFESRMVENAHEIFFKDLPGLSQSFLIFKDKGIARQFGQPEGSSKNLLYFVQNNEVFCFPHPFPESEGRLQ
jgi:hypothetical protein